MADVVVLDRIEPGWTPPYCTHGRTSCVGGCGEWCWLGDRTHDVVVSGAALPLCKQCATRLIPSGTAPSTRLADHLRVDGSHT